MLPSTNLYIGMAAYDRSRAARRDLPVTMTCRLAQTVEPPTNEFFIGKTVDAFCGERFLTEGVPDIEKIRPTLTMPDNRYWTVGECIGPAWSIGKGYRAVSTVNAARCCPPHRARLWRRTPSPPKSDITWGVANSPARQICGCRGHSQ